LVVDYNRLFQVQMKYFQNGGTSGNTGNRCHLCFFKYKGPILTSHFDSTLTFEFSTSFCQYLSVIVFDLCHLFCKKVRLEGFIKKFIIPEPSEINMWCVSCKKCLSLQHVEREIRRGFGSFLVLSIRCHKCLLLNEVEIGKTQCPDGKRIATRFDINYKAAIGKRYIFF
jgi:hypothetical protein